MLYSWEDVTSAFFAQLLNVYSVIVVAMISIAGQCHKIDSAMFTLPCRPYLDQAAQCDRTHAGRVAAEFVSPHVSSPSVILYCLQLFCYKLCPPKPSGQSHAATGRVWPWHVAQPRAIPHYAATVDQCYLIYRAAHFHVAIPAGCV